MRTFHVTGFWSMTVVLKLSHIITIVNSIKYVEFLAGDILSPRYWDAVSGRLHGSTFGSCSLFIGGRLNRINLCSQ